MISNQAIRSILIGSRDTFWHMVQRTRCVTMKKVPSELLRSWRLSSNLTNGLHFLRLKKVNSKTKISHTHPNTELAKLNGYAEYDSDHNRTRSYTSSISCLSYAFITQRDSHCAGALTASSEILKEAFICRTNGSNYRWVITNSIELYASSFKEFPPWKSSNVPARVKSCSFEVLPRSLESKDSLLRRSLF